MKTFGLLISLLVVVGCASGQSLKVENPYAMSAGVNRGTADSLVGTQYWYFYATPGGNRLTVRYKNPSTMYGAAINNNLLTITVTDDKRTFRLTKTVTAQKNATEATFTADKVAKRMKIIVAVAPPNQNLIRMGGEYEIEASGDVQFGEAASTADPIVRTYESKVNSYAATRFLADGTVIASDGSRGTWKAFDPENRIYTVQIDTFRFSVQYLPGYGLVKSGEPNTIVFQELRR